MRVSLFPNNSFKNSVRAYVTSFSYAVPCWVLNVLFCRGRIGYILMEPIIEMWEAKQVYSWVNATLLKIRMIPINVFTHDYSLAWRFAGTEDVAARYRSWLPDIVSVAARWLFRPRNDEIIFHESHRPLNQGKPGAFVVFTRHCFAENFPAAHPMLLTFWFEMFVARFAGRKFHCGFPCGRWPGEVLSYN